MNSRRIKRNTFLSVAPMLLGSLLFVGTAVAAPNSGSTTPERERSRCHTQHRLCMDVAEIDYQDCMEAFNKFNKCFAEWATDVSACLDDLNDCLDDVVATSVSSNTGVAVGGSKVAAPPKSSPKKSSFLSTRGSLKIAR